MRNVKRTLRASAKDVISDLAPPPQWIEPELCKLVTRIPAGDNWAHEIKFDGFRMHARIVSGAAALLTRNGLDWTAKYPDIAAAIGALNCRQAYVDGELCAVLPDGTTSFSGTSGEAIHVLDGLVNHDSAIDILAHHTDGGGLSDHVFAVMYLLGIKFQPRMSSPNDRMLYAFEAKGRYGSMTPFMGERLDRKLIEANWDDV